MPKNTNGRKLKMASYKPTQGMKAEAQKGLDWRKEHGRGGTRIGLTRANQIVNGENLSESTVKRMFSFFSRHEVDKEAEGFRPGEDGYPSNGRIAWALWGGDAGFSWSRGKVKQLDRERDKFFEEELTTKRAELINDWEEHYIRSKKDFGKLERKQFDEHWEKIKKLEQTKIKKQYEIFISILEKAERENADLFPTGKKWSYFF